MDCKSSVSQFLHSLLAQKGDLQPMENTTSLFSTGRLQSIDGIQIAVFLEQNFGVDFAAIGFDQEKIDSVDSICALINEARSLA